MWDSLVLAPGVKRHLLAYARSALIFSDEKVSSHIVSWNRLILLYGPPGNGKASLCRALAHKLAIRMNDRFSSATLLEIHSHSLFSKWGFPSVKLIHRLFELVRGMIEDDPTTLVCVLVAEVESLAGCRIDLGGAGEPSDAMRAVNALLTCLGRLRCFPNVLVLTTTNLAPSVDAAFVDRADVKQFIGLPDVKAGYEILCSCLAELVRVGIVENDDECHATLPYPFEAMLDDIISIGEARTLWTFRLGACAALAGGFSGRTLRRLPLQSHARCGLSTGKIFMELFLDALDEEIGIQQTAAEQASRRDLDSTEA
jgi:SpoVK/Ycf46/Vps4 family AAA+-type ATPase